MGDESDAENTFWLCVSNNERHPRLEEFIAVQLTTTRRPRLSTWVPLSAQDEPWTGSVACDEIGPIYRDQSSQGRRCRLERDDAPRRASAAHRPRH